MTFADNFGAKIDDLDDRRRQAKARKRIHSSCAGLLKDHLNKASYDVTIVSVAACISNNTVVSLFIAGDGKSF